jgi:hypothetical protein
MLVSADAGGFSTHILPLNWIELCLIIFIPICMPLTQHCQQDQADLAIWCHLHLSCPRAFCLSCVCAPQFIQLAGLTGTTATSRLRSSSSGRDACLPGPVPRPPGPVALLGPRQGNLWLVNSLGQPVLLPLTHPGGAPLPTAQPTATTSSSAGCAASEACQGAVLADPKLHRLLALMTDAEPAAVSVPPVQAFAPGACVRRVTLLVLLLLGARGLTLASMTAWLPSWPCRAVWLGPTWPSWDCRDSAWQWRQSCAWSQVGQGCGCVVSGSRG